MSTSTHHCRSPGDEKSLRVGSCQSAGCSVGSRKVCKTRSCDLAKESQTLFTTATSQTLLEMTTCQVMGNGSGKCQLSPSITLSCLSRANARVWKRSLEKGSAVSKPRMDLSSSAASPMRMQEHFCHRYKHVC